jgi:hypothetical protein
MFDGVYIVPGSIVPYTPLRVYIIPLSTLARVEKHYPAYYFLFLLLQIDSGDAVFSAKVAGPPSTYQPPSCHTKNFSSRREKDHNDHHTTREYTASYDIRAFLEYLTDE